MCEEECMGHSPEDEPLTLTKYHSFMKSWRGGDSSVAQVYNLRVKGNISFFVSFGFTNLLLSLISWHDVRTG